MQNLNDNAARLAQLKADIQKNNVCPELAQNATQLVMGDGNPRASVVFIGEAPGKNEDLKGRPFVGAAGKLLDEMLDQADMKRSDVYITNIVKYRPPNNRDPEPAEKKAFWPYLISELNIIKPIVVATLGRHSMEYFLPNQKISQIHGQPKSIKYDKLNIVIMPLYHPAAALYNGSLRATLFEDFAHLWRVLELTKITKGETK